MDRAHTKLAPVQPVEEHRINPAFNSVAASRRYGGTLNFGVPSTSIYVHFSKVNITGEEGGKPDCLHRCTLTPVKYNSTSHPFVLYGDATAHSRWTF